MSMSLAVIIVRTGGSLINIGVIRRFARNGTATAEAEAAAAATTASGSGLIGTGTMRRRTGGVATGLVGLSGVVWLTARRAARRAAVYALMRRSTSAVLSSRSAVNASSSGVSSHARRFFAGGRPLAADAVALMCR
jgi:hypothetical protein